MSFIKICRTILLLILLVTVSKTYAQKGLHRIKNNSFKQGERLKFRVHYGFIDAGYVTMEVKDESKTFGGNRNCFHIVGIGESAGKIDWFFKVRDRYETFLDMEAIVPWFHIRSVKEGGYKFEETDSFNHYQNTATNKDGVFQVPEGIQDILSSYYFTRCAYTSNMKEGDQILVNVFLDNKITPFNVKYVGKEVIDTKFGKVKCIKFKPQLQQGRVFKDQEGMSIWISDDKNYIPIRLEAKLLIGSIKMDILEYSGLANPFSSLDD
jgi:hypothetical protein